MTTWLRHIGASILGIVNPVPSTTASPMSEEDGAWVRANAWTKGLRLIEDAYPRGFHRWCSCERGICIPCGSGKHAECVSAQGPRLDKDAGTVTDQRGFVVALIQYRPNERPCRRLCPCTHPAGDEATPATDQSTSTAGSVPSPAGQLSFSSSADELPQLMDGEA